MLRKKLKILNLEISYLIEDTNKQKILFIHGINSSASFVYPLYYLENRNYDIISIDLPGHGKSTIKGKTTLQLYKNVVREFIKELNLTNFIMAGHSLGAVSAIANMDLTKDNYCILISPFNPFIYNYKNQFSRLLSHNPFKKKPLITPENKNKNRFLRDVELFFNKFGHINEILKDLYDNHLFSKEDNQNKLMVDYDKIRNQENVLIINGLYDKFVYFKTIIDLHNEYNVNYFFLSKSGHSPIRDETNNVNTIIMDYVSKKF